jgi:tetratricopeptide (TPR) repeat protein
MVSKNAAERLRGLIYCDAGDLVESRRCFQACIERIQANEDEFAPPEKSYSLFTADWIPTAVAAYIFMLAMVDLREGDTGSARKKADEIRRYLAHYADLLHGEALLAEGAYDKAITVCQKAPVWSVPYMSDTDSMLAYNLPALKDVLARALELRQELDSAIEEYKRLTTVDPKDRPRQLIHPLYHYRLANLYLTKGWRAKAVDEYRAFAHLWDEADAGGPEFHNAQAALKSLGSSGSTPGSGLAI